jgi:peroxiredoxin (alkyl hydroperoxide reductase subunit C)
MKKLMVSVTMLLVFGTMSWSQDEIRIPLIGSDAPSFSAQSTNGKIEFPKDFGKSWKILFSHPQDFTPVCTTEILELAAMDKEFEKLNVKIAVISADNLSTHNDWKKHMEEIDFRGLGQQKIHFPLFADDNLAISKKYGMLHTTASTKRDIRGVFVIDPENKVRLINFYPMNIGRNMEEIKRTVLALQTSGKDNVLMPANWEPGQDVIVPYKPYSDEELKANPKLKDQYYMMGDRVWFKRIRP